ncbi:hypothetical protein [Streptomyces sp. NPDC046685]
MLHLRMITPHHLTDRVVELIDQTVGTTHLAVRRNCYGAPGTTG